MSDVSAGAESSSALLQKARAGDDEALARLVNRYRPRLRRWIDGRLPAGGSAAGDLDVVIEAVVVETVGRSNPSGEAAGWRIGAQLRDALMRRMGGTLRGGVTASPGADQGARLDASGASPLERAIGSLALERYEEALERLSPSNRELIVMRVELACEYGEIAHAMGMNDIDHARAAVREALAHLAREMARLRTSDPDRTGRLE